MRPDWVIHDPLGYFWSVKIGYFEFKPISHIIQDFQSYSLLGKAKKETPKPKNKKNINKNLKRIEENNRVLKMILENQR